MEDTAYRAVAIVGVGAILPDAPNAPAFWRNILDGRYSISDVDPRRWDPALYYDPDPKAPDKTYSRIGGWIREAPWDPIGWHLPIPPRVSDAMDDVQKWAVAAAHEALTDFGYPERALDHDRTAVILGNAMAGERHYLTSTRILSAEIEQELVRTSVFRDLPEPAQRMMLDEWRHRVGELFPQITEDTMPGELANCMPGRIANLFNFHGPNFVTDAACASAMAAVSAALEGLVERDYDTVIAGGVDRNMGPATFVKFCKIGALSATGTRPYADGADGFVMGEGAAVFVLKRLADAERDGDRIYAVIRGVGGSSDGRGKGITAPNPVGQKFCIERAWANAGLSPATASLIEGHGTSTKVGDVVEVESLSAVLGAAGAMPRSIPLGSVKSNIGHLKGAAGAAGMLKVALALHHRVLPPSLGCATPNPNIDFEHSPFFVNTELRDWAEPQCGVRRAGVSAFGFGGTNFHLVLEEYVPGRLRVEDPARSVAVPAKLETERAATPAIPLRGALLIGAANETRLIEKLRQVHEDAESGVAPPPAPPSAADLASPERLAIDYGDARELADRSAKALKAFDSDTAIVWKALRAQGVFRGRGPARKVAFLYTGQGSQYVNMLADLRATNPIVAGVFAEADRVTEPLLGKPLTEFIFVDPRDERALAEAEEGLKQTAITQPAVLAVDEALTRLMAAYGVEPDMVMGHSLGEYGALVAAKGLPFQDALVAVSARGREMSRVSVADCGWMVAVFAPMPEIERILKTIDGYVVVANINSNTQAVIGGASDAVERAMNVFLEAGYNAIRLPVSHAFHTSIVAPASDPLRRELARLAVASPATPVVANVTGDFYPTGPNVVPEILDLLARQVASPVQFVAGLGRLYDAGARIFVEMGPKKALQGFADDVLGARDDVVSLFTNHPKTGDAASFNLALCGLYAAGHGAGVPAMPVPEKPVIRSEAAALPAPSPRPALQSPSPDEGTISRLGHLFAEFLDRGMRIYSGRGISENTPAQRPAVVVTGAGLGLPGTERIFDDMNVSRILHGEQFIDVVPNRFRKMMLEKHITRLVKSKDGNASFEAITDPTEVVRLAARGGSFDLGEEFGISADRLPALDRVTKLAMAAGLEALKDAGIPLVLRYKTTTTGKQLPDKWALPESMSDDTGVIFASAFPGLDSFAEYLNAYHEDHARHERLGELESLRSRLTGSDSAELDRRIDELKTEIERHPFTFDRRFLFRVLAMGHSQFAELIGARGPNTQVNSACASTTQAMAMAEDWISLGRCGRVVIVAADDVTSENLMDWMGAGFLASGAAATDDVVENAATPFDRRRHGMILGMGAAAIVVEREDRARQRGLRPICELLGAATANSAFHGTRLDVNHICSVMEKLVSDVEARWGISREVMASRMVFVSHETYTPARGGSAAAEVHALRSVFGDGADRIVVANTKGFTGHPMGVGIEDVVAIKALETGLVPPVANYKEVDPDLGRLNLSKGGAYPVEFALRLGAGFGSQISMTLVRLVPSADGTHPRPDALGYEYRIVDPSAWSHWLASESGYEAPGVETVNRTFRIKDQGAPARNQPPVEPLQAVVDAGEPPVAASGASATAPPAVSATIVAPQDPIHVAQSAGDTVQERVLDLVVEKTGYPRDMLDLDLDLEADLGVDTVKQAELFAAIRGVWNIPRDENLKLRDFPTIAHAIQFVYDRRPDLQPVVEDRVPAVEPGPSVEPVEADGDDVAEKVLALVEEKTGYPRDMLDLDLDLEADLGIDTVKQAEIFAAARSLYGIPRDENLKLRDFPTLGLVIQFVRDRIPAAAAVEQSPDTAVTVTEEGSAGRRAAGSAPRKIPVVVARPPLELCKGTGVELGPGSRMLVMMDTGGVGQALVARLSEMGSALLVVDDAPSASVLVERIAEFAREGPLTGVFWLPALDDEGPLSEMTIDDWREKLRRRVKLLYSAMRLVGGQLEPSIPFLVSASRLGGCHGYDEAGATSPLGGAVTGFTKAYKRERPEATVKAVDFSLGADPDDIAVRLIEEALRDPGAVEIGYTGDLRCTIAVEESPLTEAVPGPGLASGTVFLITGAAGSITSAITSDLAAASSGVFYLLDLALEPDRADPMLRRFETDRAGLQRDLFERLKARGERATPAMVEKELARMERSHAALKAIEAIEAHGGTVRYFSGDLRDPDVSRRVADEIRTSHGRVDVLVHAAGLEISRKLAGKEQEEFDLVFDVKADGWFNVLHALGEMPIGATVAFSSIAGRFGNSGQTDYSAANDLLCKMTSSFRHARPSTAGLVVDWTAWGEIGMASRGSIPQIMERAGIDMLPPAEGIPVIRHELAAGTRGEIVVAGRLGILANEHDESGGLDVDLVQTRKRGPMTCGRVIAMRANGELQIETTLDPAVQPFLNDHRIDGTPVLPGVMGIEAFAEIATLLFPHLHVAAIEDVEFLAPFKLYRDEPRDVVLTARYTSTGEGLMAECRLAGTRVLAGQVEPQVTTHFTARVRLVEEPFSRRVDAPREPSVPVVNASDIYRIYFHGPAYQVLDCAWRDSDRLVGRFKRELPAACLPSGDFLPARPRLIELCFQTAGVFDLSSTGRMSLPNGLSSVRASADTSSGDVYAIVTANTGTGGYDAMAVDSGGRVLVEFRGYRTIEVPGELDLAALKPLREAVARGGASS